jgi:hypothetical protein
VLNLIFVNYGISNQISVPVVHSVWNGQICWKLCEAIVWSICYEHYTCVNPSIKPDQRVAKGEHESLHLHNVNVAILCKVYSAFLLC